MRTPSEQLIQTTWMAEHKLFKNHDAVTPINWFEFWLQTDTKESHNFTKDEFVLISVLHFLCDSDAAGVSLSEISELPELERQAVVDSLRLKWSKVELQENL